VNTQPTDKGWIDMALLLLLATIWSSSFTAIKFAVPTMPPLTLVAVRTLIAVAVLVPIMAVQGGRLPRDSKSWTIGFALGVFGISLPFFLIGWGEQRVSSGLAAILIGIMPLATMVLAHFFNEGDRFTMAKFAGIVLGFTGIVVLIGPEALKGLGGDAIYQLAVAGGALCYAINAVLTRNLPSGGGGRGDSRIGRGIMVLLCGTAIAVPLALAIDGPDAILRADTNAWLGAVYLGVLPTGLATLIYFRLVEVRGASFFSFVNYLNPVFGVVLGALILGEVLSIPAVAALVLILAGVAVTNRKRRA
jgi:drug/metabolite transporter (DMT)-like permease